MIFLTTEKNGVDGIFLIFTDADVQTLRRGQTLFVRSEQLPRGFAARRVDVGYAPTQERGLEMIRAAGHRLEPGGFIGPKQAEDEAVCDDCQGLMPVSSLNHGRCIVCWRKLAISKMGESN